MLPVQSNVPIPKPERKLTRRTYPYEDLNVGDMFFVPNRKRNNLITHTSNVGKQLKRKFTTRLTHMKSVNDQWVPADKEEPNAVIGVGVWRVE